MKPEDTSNVHELHDVQPTLSDLVSRNELLMTAEAAGDLLLAKALPLPRGNKRLDQGSIPGIPEAFAR